MSADYPGFRVDYRIFFSSTLALIHAILICCLLSKLKMFLCCRTQNNDAECGGAAGGGQTVLPGGQDPHVHPVHPSETKSCCGVSVSQTVSIRWFIVMIAFVGICCAVVGTVLGAMKASGREHLTVSLLMIGQYFSILYRVFVKTNFGPSFCFNFNFLRVWKE